MAAFCSGNWKEGTTVTQIYGLPFDDELEPEEMTEEEAKEAYRKAKEVTENWIKQKNG